MKIINIIKKTIMLDELIPWLYSFNEDIMYHFRRITFVANDRLTKHYVSLSTKYFCG